VDQRKVKEEIANAERDSKAGSKNKNEVIVDDAQTTKQGSWLPGKSGGNYMNGYHFKGKGTGAGYAPFVPNLPVAGDYEVYEWHVAGANRSSDTPHIITYKDGTQTVNVNQQINGGQWNLIGTFAFDAGTSGEVRITDQIPIQGQIVMADGIRFVLVGSSAPGDASTPTARDLTPLRNKQVQLEAEAAKTRADIEAAEARLAEIRRVTDERAALREQNKGNASEVIATVPTPGATTIVQPNVNYNDAQSRAVQALRLKEDQLNGSLPATARKGQKGKAAPVVVAEPERPITAKEIKLNELLRRYKADEITPREYHQERAKIIAEP